MIKDKMGNKGEGGGGGGGERSGGGQREVEIIHL